MDRIKALYQTLSKSEIKALKTYLSAFHTKGENKPLELLRLLEKRPALSAESASQKLYSDPRSKAFIMMKSRLYEKMTEFLALSVNPGSGPPNKEMPYYGYIVEFRKNMLTAALLWERRMRHLAREFLDKALKLAIKCNNPELEVDVLLRIRGMQLDIGKDFEELTRDIRDAMERQERDISAVGIYNRFLEMHNLRSALDHKKVEFLESTVPKLEDDLRQKYSPRADYYYQMLTGHYHSIKGNYEACKEANERAIAVVDKYPGIRNRQRVADPYFQLGILEMKFHEYEASIAAMEQALRYQKPQTRAFFMVVVMQLYAYIFRGDLDMAERRCREVDAMLARPIKGNVEVLRGWYTYLKSCVRYLRGEYSEAWTFLQEANELNFDKEGWISGIRIFEIMILLDRDQPDVASQKLENLRKHLRRYPTDARFEVIYKLLAAQERMGFFFEPFKGEDLLLDQLQTEYPWKHVGHEVIRFDDWYRKKRGLDS